MQGVYTTLPIGTTVREQYIIEDPIGKGEFSAVYLVRDRRDDRRFFALKEVSNSDRKARNKRSFEAAPLKRLNHPALPRVHDIFTDGVQGRTYILMDYIEGQNLEVLRQGQPEQRFPLPQIISLIAPIMDAVTYLHNQTPPIIHGDVKPSNIILSKASGTTVLVDFDLARAYETAINTSTVQHGTSAYAAPEQYSRRSDPGTDIYALGATLYTLSTGTVPADACSRSAQLNEKKPDPLAPVNQIAPAVPKTIARAIRRAMSISSAERFSSVEQFWDALWQVSNVAALSGVPWTMEFTVTDQIKGNTEPDANTAGEQITEPVIENLENESEELNANIRAQQAPDPIAARVVPLRPLVFSQKEVTTPVPVSLQEQPGGYGSKKSARLSHILLTLAVILLIGAGIGTSAWLYTESHHSPRSAPPTLAGQHQPTPQSTASPNSQVTPTPASTTYPKVSQSYSGTIHDITANITTQASLTRIQQQQQSISGSFTGLGISSPLKGTIDTTKHIQFVVMGNAGQAILSFDGFMQPDGSIGGSYCSSGQAGKCSDYGIWSVTPVAP